MLDPSTGQPPPFQPPPGNLFHRIARSFYFAFVGLAYLFRPQRNARTHLFIAACACALGAWLHIDRVSWSVIVLAIAAVLLPGGLKTGLGGTGKLASPRPHPLAGTAK